MALHHGLADLCNTSLAIHLLDLLEWYVVLLYDYKAS